MNVLGKIHIMHWNCYGIKSKFPQLQAMVQLFDVICVQESLLWQHNHFWLQGFNIIRKDIFSSNERGICTLISEKIIYTVLNLSFVYSPLKVQRISLTLNKPLTITSIAIQINILFGISSYSFLPENLDF